MPQRRSQRKVTVSEASIGITLIYISVALIIAVLSLLRHYLSWWLSLIIAAGSVVAFIVLISFLGRHGKLNKFGHWITGG